MRTAKACMGVVLACGCSAASGGQFTLIGTLDASDNPAVLGAPITTDGTFYQDVAGGNNPPTPFFIALIPSLEFDSYIALDGLNANGLAAPSGASYEANAAQSALPTEFTESTLRINSAFALPGTGITSAQRELSGGLLDAVFFARLTVVGGSGGVEAPSVVVNIADGEGGIANLDLDVGLDVIGGVSGPGGQFYAIFVEQSESDFGTVNDLYVVAYIPGPGAAGLVALSGVVGFRRRRRRGS